MKKVLVYIWLDGRWEVLSLLNDPDWSMPLSDWQGKFFGNGSNGCGVEGGWLRFKLHWILQTIALVEKTYLWNPVEKGEGLFFPLFRIHI
jgi:hypothetical protein